jgi:aspartate carbamoyltransferase regulatory subunit
MFSRLSEGRFSEVSGVFKCPVTRCISLQEKEKNKADSWQQFPASITRKGNK